MSIAIRPVSVEDADGIAAIYDHYIANTICTFEEEPIGPLVMAGRIAAICEGYPWLVAEQSGVLLGYAYAGGLRNRSAYRWAVECTVYLDATARGKGVGTRLYRCLLGCLIDQGFTRAMAAIALPNPASVALHERCGFSACGSWPASGRKQGQWIDVGWYQRALAPESARPAEPTLPDPQRIAGRCAEADAGPG